MWICAFDEQPVDDGGDRNNVSWYFMAAVLVANGEGRNRFPHTTFNWGQH